MGLFDSKRSNHEDKVNTELRMAAMAELADEGVTGDGALFSESAAHAVSIGANDDVVNEVAAEVELSDTQFNLLADDAPDDSELAPLPAVSEPELIAEPAPEIKPEQEIKTEPAPAVAPSITASKLTKIMGNTVNRATDKRLLALNNPALPVTARIVEETGEIAWFVGKLLCVNGDESKSVNGWCLSQYFDSLIRDHFEKGLCHLEGGPSYVKTGPCNTEVWYRKGVVGREDGPAITARHDCGLVSEQFIVDGNVLRKLSTSETGSIESFFKGTLMNHVNHAPEGSPSVIWRDPDGNVVGQEFKVDGILHREGDKPAVMHGAHSEWWVRGERHRIGGAAIITRKGDKSYYLQGKEVTMNAVSKASLDERNNVGIGKAKEEVAVIGDMSEKKREHRDRISSWKSSKKGL